MKKVIIQFEFPDEYSHQDTIDVIMGALYDMDSEFSDKVTYTILDRQ